MKLSDDIREARELLVKATAKIEEATELTRKAADLLSGSRKRRKG